MRRDVRGPRPSVDRRAASGSARACFALCFAAISSFTAACGAPPSKVETPVAAAKSAGATTTPGAPDTPDAAFRYMPPDLGASTPAVPRVEDVRLSNGVTARLLEKRGNPVVGVVMVVRWTAIAKVPGTASLLGAAFADLELPSGHTLKDDLKDLGTNVFAHTDEDATYLRIAVLHDQLEPALALILSALRTGKLGAAALDRARDRAVKSIDAEDAMEKHARVVGAHLFAASHRYHDAPIGTADGLKKLKPDDLTRFRDGALAPDAVSFAVVGAVSKTDLDSTLERVAGGWTAPAASTTTTSATPTTKPPAKDAKTASTSAGPAHGVFLVESADASPTARAHASLLVPLPDVAQPDHAAALMSWGALGEHGAARMDSTFPDGKWGMESRILPRRLTRMVELHVSVVPGNAAIAIEALLKAMDEVGKGQVSDSEMLEARRSRIVRALPSDGIDPLLWQLEQELANGEPAGAELGLAAAISAVPRDAVLRASAAYFRKDRLSVVVTGAKPHEKEAFEKLGIGPVVFDKSPTSASQGDRK